MKFSSNTPIIDDPEGCIVCGGFIQLGQVQFPGTGPMPLCQGCHDDTPRLRAWLARQLETAMASMPDKFQQLVDGNWKRRKEPLPPSEKYVVRLYDGMDNQWMDVSEPVLKEEAQRIWEEKTKGGTEKTCFSDIDYFRIFPADTRMLYAEGRGEIER